MKLSWILLSLLGYIVCFDHMASLNNPIVDAKTLQSFSDNEIEEKIKDIKTTNGDTYECVDFYKQPAFAHPSMNKSLIPLKMRRILSLRSSKANYKKFGYLWENGIGCPIGTVPIKKVNKDELLRLNLFSKKYRPQGSWNFTYNQSNNESNQHHFAVARTKEGDDRLYNGATMILSSHDPKVKLPQYSSARMHIQIGADDYIQAGWTVNPKLYSDNKTRTFVFTKTGEKECYNSMCSTGFVLVRSDLPLGLALSPPSVRTEVHVNFYGLLKDKANGNWFFKFEGEEIGFWPANRFEQGPSNGIEWGGEVYSAFMPSPPMGNGYFPDKRYLYNAFITNITIVNEKFEIDDQVKYTEAFSDNTRGYKVIDSVHSLLSDKHMIQFGGPGNI